MSRQKEVLADLGIVTKSIDNHNFEITLLPCGPAGRVFFSLMDVIGPGIGIAADKYRNFEYVSPEDDSTWAEIAGMFSSSLRSGELDFVIDSILEDCLIDGERLDSNRHLRGEFSTYMRLVYWAIEQNFSQLFMDALKEFGLGTDILKKFTDMMKRQESLTTTGSQISKEET